MALHTIEICAGVGMLGEGLRAGLGHMGYPLRTVCYVEREAYAAATLAARCQEESLDDAPVWSDLLTFDAGAWRGAVDGIVAGFPCQDLSLAGRRAGLDGKRSGLFFNILDIADHCGAWFLFLENVAGIASATASVVGEAEGELDERAASRVVGELAERGWHAEWLTLSASDVGASHGRERWFCFAWRNMGNTHNERAHGSGARAKQGWCTESAHASGQMGHAGLQHQHLQQWHERAESAGTDGIVADTQRSSSERPGNAGKLACAGIKTETEARERQRGRFAADGNGCTVADAECSCDRTQEQAANCGWDTQAVRPADQHGGCSRSLLRPFFAPGPTDLQWSGILEQWPERAPALEPDFRGMADGMAYAMDESRTQRLKCIGNGVVALQAAAATVALARRAGLPEAV